MSEATEGQPAESNVRRLSDAIRDVKNAMVDRDDVVVEMREAERTRLELLVAELESVIADAPPEHPAFDFVISAGAQPRFWIDGVSHVGMGRDRRTYRFVRDTRQGREILAESTDIKPVADAVTRYVAERIVERQRMLEGALPTHASPEKAAAAPVKAPTPSQEPENKAGEVLTWFVLMVIGAIAGAAVTVALLRDRIPELQNLFQ